MNDYKTYFFHPSSRSSLVIRLVGCAEEREDILHPRVPTLNLTEPGISPRFDQSVHFITDSEPLPYPIWLHITIRAAVFATGQSVGVLHEIDAASRMIDPNYDLVNRRTLNLSS